jgi:hypothetical protein
MSDLKGSYQPSAISRQPMSNQQSAIGNCKLALSIYTLRL